jgi:acetyl-CoA carboxylase biotin carboxyl carrier protein
VTDAGESSAPAGGQVSAMALSQQPAQSDDSAIWLGDLRAIISAFEASDFTELELRAPPLRIALRRNPSVVTALPILPAEESADPDGLHVVRCPLTGVWYDAPSPGAPPYVSVGDPVEVGMTVGLIETMKVFNEVTADAAGIVRQVLVHRGDLVTAHAALLTLEPTKEVSAPPPGA